MFVCADAAQEVFPTGIPLFAADARSFAEDIRQNPACGRTDRREGKREQFQKTAWIAGLPNQGRASWGCLRILSAMDTAQSLFKQLTDLEIGSK